MNNTDMRRILYRLHRGAVGVHVYHQSGQQYNLATGEKSVQIDVYRTKAVILPDRTWRDFAYDLSYIAANKNFTYGAIYVTSERNMLFFASDLPRNFRFSVDDYIYYDGKRWDVKEAAAVDMAPAFYVKVKQVEMDVTALDDTTKTFIDGVTDNEIVIAAVDELVRRIKYIFGTVSNFYLWPMVGTTHGKRGIWPMTNFSTDIESYTQFGVNGGYIGDDVNDIGTGKTIELDDFTVMLYGRNLVGNLAGCNDGVNTFSLTDTAVDAGGGDVAIDLAGAKCVAVVGVGNNSLKVFNDGVLDVTDTTVRDVSAIVEPLHVLSDNGSIVGNPQVSSIVIAKALSDVNIGLVYNALKTFNDKLGR